MAKKNTIITGSMADNILQELKQVRKELNYVSAMMRIMELSAFSLRRPVSRDTAKKFFTELVASSPISPPAELKRKIVLMSWNLLGDGDIIWSDKVSERRKQFVKAYNFKGLTGNSKDPADLNHTEDSIYKTIANYFVSTLVSDRQFFLNVFDGVLPDEMVIDAPLPVNNLPLRTGSFIGRKKYLEQIHENFNNSSASNPDLSDSIIDNHLSTKIQILYGMGGIGKTEIVKHYAYFYMGEYKAIIWIDFTNDETIYSSTIDFLMQEEPALTISSADQARHLLLRFMADTSSFLLILDNVDYLDENKKKETALLSRLKSYIPNHGGHILITSRCNYDFLNATRIKVAGLNTKDADTLIRKDIEDKVEDIADELVIRDFLVISSGMPLMLVLFSSILKERGFIYIERDIAYSYQTLLEQRIAGRKAITEVFEPTARKLVGDTIELKAARELLFHYASLGAEYLPIAEYQKVVEKVIDAGQDIPKLEVAEPKVLADAINILVKYSIADYDSESIYIHPVLAELIRKYNTPRLKTLERLNIYADRILALVYGKYGDKEASDQYLKAAAVEAMADGKEAYPEWFKKVADDVFNDDVI